MRIPDNDLIRNIERYGYPEPWNPLQCPNCQGEMTDRERLVSKDGTWMCMECFVGEITDTVKNDPEKFAKEHGYEIREVEVE